MAIKSGKGQRQEKATKGRQGPRSAPTRTPNGLRQAIRASRRTFDLALLPPGQRQSLAHELLQVGENRAIQRLAASGELLQLAPLDGLNLAASDFWTRLEDRVASTLSNWLSHRMGGAVEQFDTDMHARSEQGIGAFTLNTTITLIGLIPTVGSYASTVAGIARDVYKQLPLNRPVSLEDFLFRVRRNIEQASLSVTNRSAPLFTQIRSARGSETPENQAQTRRQVVQELNSALQALPSLSQVLQALVTDWINSSRDSWDLGDWGGMEAGNIYVSYNYWPSIGEGLWGVNTRPFIDDVARPEGTKQALRHAFGENTFLHQLPFQMNVTVRSLIQVERRAMPQDMARIIKPARSDMRVHSGEPEWRLDSGSESLLRAWQAMTRKPRIRDLVAD